jgi:hypothetical protein
MRTCRLCWITLRVRPRSTITRRYLGGWGGDDAIDAKQDFELKSKLGIGAHGTRHTHMMSALTCALGVVYHAVHIPSRAEVALKSVFGGSDADVEQVGDMLGSRVC